MSGPVQQVLHYATIPLRRPRLLAAFTLLPVLIALFYGIIVPAPYKTSAVVAMIKSRTDVKFDERIVTINDDPNSAAGAEVTNQQRAAELALLVQNSAIAKDVVTRLKDQLPPPLQNPATLIKRIQGNVINPGTMIAVTAVDPDPEMAALIANTWASSYELYVNTLYSGAATGYSKSVQTELERAKQQYDEAQKALEDFLPQNKIGGLTRDLNTKKAVLSLYSTTQTEAISSTLAQQIDAQQQVINAYLTAQTANQLLAFNKQQEAQRQLLAEFIDKEIESRMFAIRRDRDLREKAFNTASEEDINNKMTVINQEADAKREALAQAYADQTRLQKLLANARTMRNQINEGGDSAAASNTLALLLLKAQIFTGQGTGDADKTSNLPGNVQLQASGTTPSTAAGQLRDIDAVIVAIQDRLDTLQTEIQTQSQQLLAGTGYNFLSEFSANDNTLPVTSTTVLSSTSPVSISLMSAITQRYNELFDVGSLAQSAVRPNDATPLFTQIKQLYPDLFSFDALSELTRDINTDSPLYKAAMQQTQDLLELKNLESLSDSQSGSTTTQSLNKIQDDVNALQAQLEAETTRLSNLTQARDLARDTYTTLAKKQEEVNIATAITGSEVRLAIPAMTASIKTRSTMVTMIIAAMIGFLFGIASIMLIHLLMGEEPLGGVWGKPNAFWNRAVRWLSAPTKRSLLWIPRTDDGMSSAGERSATS